MRISDPIMPKVKDFRAIVEWYDKVPTHASTYYNGWMLEYSQLLFQKEKVQNMMRERYDQRYVEPEMLTFLQYTIALLPKHHMDRYYKMYPTYSRLEFVQPEVSFIARAKRFLIACFWIAVGSSISSAIIGVFLHFSLLFILIMAACIEVIITFTFLRGR